MAVTMSVAGRVPVDVAEVNGHAHRDVVLRPGAMVTREQAAANLANDCKLAERTAPPVPADGRPTPEEHVMSQAGSRVADEGENLLANGREH